MKKQQQTYLYRLPDDRELVQQVAFGQTMEMAYRCVINACSCAQRRLPCHFRDAALVLLVQDCVARCIQVEYPGRCGTNNLEEFRRIFAAIVPRVYVDFSDLLASTPEAVAFLRSFKSDYARLAHIDNLSQAQLALLDSPLDGPLPLRWRLDGDPATSPDPTR